jgi:PAS domain S-box-containing protein
MEESSRTREELIKELQQLRKRNRELELCLKENQQNALLSKCEQQQGLLRSIIEALPVGLWITDAKGKMLEINNHARTIWGGDVPYANNVSEYAQYKARWAETEKEVLAEEMPMAQALKGRIIKEVALDFDRFDGTQGTQLVSAAPIRDAKGNIIGCVGIAQDITKQKKVEYELSQSENRFRSFVVATSDVVYRMNADWSEMWQLRGKNFIEDTEKPNSKWLDVYIWPENQQEISEVIEEAIRAKSVFELEHPVRTLDGSQGWVRSRAVPILDFKGNIVEWFGTARDITMQKKAIELQVANRTLEESIEMKDEFLSLVSHEFRTPINVISVAIQALNSIYKHEMTPHIKKYIRTIRQNNLRQLRLVNNLLDITKAYSNTTKINKKNVDIVFLTKCITESVEEYALQKNIELAWESSLKKKIIAIDDEKYERILLNLLSNAIKFTPKGKSVRVRVYCYRGKVFIQVMDKGIGIPHDKIEMIFKKFGQVNSVLSRQAEGTGIGLSLVNKFIEALGGNITVKSQVGKGSIFTISFPDERMIEEEEIEVIDLVSSRIIQSTDVEFADLYL